MAVSGWRRRGIGRIFGVTTALCSACCGPGRTVLCLRCWAAAAFASRDTLARSSRSGRHLNPPQMPRQQNSHTERNEVHVLTRDTFELPVWRSASSEQSSCVLGTSHSNALVSHDSAVSGPRTSGLCCLARRRHRQRCRSIDILTPCTRPRGTKGSNREPRRSRSMGCVPDLDGCAMSTGMATTLRLSRTGGAGGPGGSEADGRRRAPSGPQAHCRSIQC